MSSDRTVVPAAVSPAASVIFGFAGKNDFLSNFFVEYDGLTGEHRFQAAKTDDASWIAKVLTAPTPAKAKYVGRSLPLRREWEDVKLGVMLEVVAQKFLPGVNPGLTEKLLATGNAVLIEANRWNDVFWGVDEKTGAGRNELGIVLMKVRAGLRQTIIPAAAPAVVEMVSAGAPTLPTGPLERITVATDGSAAPTNPGPSGWAWYVNEDCWAAGANPHATNNRAELAAVLNLFRATAEQQTPLHIRIDSKYVIGMLNGNKAVANAELVAKLRAAAHGRDYTLEWVKGHNGDPMNEAVDAKCTAASAAVHAGTEIPRGPGWSL